MADLVRSLVRQRKSFDNQWVASAPLFTVDNLDAVVILKAHVD